MVVISYYYQAMASPEAICGNCKFFSTTYTNGEPKGQIDTPQGKVSLGTCRAPMGLVLGDRKETNPCQMPEGTFEAVPTSLTQNRSALKESPAL